MVMCVLLWFESLQSQGDDQAVLWLDEIQEGVDRANKQTTAANKRESALNLMMQLMM